nr:hypothetical protein [Pseudarthrobacter sp. NBSH8]
MYWAIVALRRHAQQTLSTEMERVRVTQGSEANAEEVELALRRMLRQLLHVPTVRARELAEAGRQDDFAAAIEVLFGLVHPSAEAVPGGSDDLVRQELSVEPAFARPSFESLVMSAPLAF